MRTICCVVISVVLPFLAFSRDDNIARISLHTDTHDFSKPFYIGLYFQMEPGWYIYWQNPGDAGIPPEVTWHLPEGLRVSDVQYPTPERFDTQGLVSFGYKDEAMLLFEVTPDENFQLGDQSEIVAHASWMVCRESCILEDGSAVLPLHEARPDTELMMRFRGKLPEPIDQASVRLLSATQVRDERRVTVTLSFDGEPISDFFPGPVSNFILPHENIRIDKNQIQFTLRPYSAVSKLNTINGLVFVNGKAYYFSTAVESVNQE